MMLAGGGGQAAAVDREEEEDAWAACSSGSIRQVTSVVSCRSEQLETTANSGPALAVDSVPLSSAKSDAPLQRMAPSASSQSSEFD